MDRSPQIAGVTWTAIRLELARTESFPQGSAGRAFLLHVPVNAQGFIDSAALHKSPTQAIVRRFWPSEPDQVGRIERANEDWAFCCRAGKAGETMFRLDDGPLLLGQIVMIHGPDGVRLPFRVVCARVGSTATP